MPRVVPLSEVWPQLAEGVTTLLKDINRPMTSEEWMSLHNLVVQFCTASSGANTGSGARFRGGELYEELSNLLESHTQDLLGEAEDKMGIDLLNYYELTWGEYTMAGKVVHHIFMYMNRYWLRRQREESQQQQKEVYTVQELTYHKWRFCFFDKVKARLLQAILHEVERERMGEQINRTLLRNVIRSYVKMAFRINNPKEEVLDVYEAELETGFIHATELFYTMESTQFLNENSCSDYMKKVETRLEEEAERVGHYLHNSSATQLIRKCEDVLIKHHMDKIQAEFPSMLEQDKQDDLRRLYNLLSRIENGLDPLRKIFKEHVKEDGIERIQALAAGDGADGDDDDDDGGEGGSDQPAGKDKDKGKDKGKKKDKKPKQEFKPYVETLMEIHDKYYQLVVDVFAKDKGFHTEMNKAFDYFMNLEGNRSPEFLSLYIDDKLKKGLKGVTEEQIDAIIDRCLILFKRLEEKDLFERYYKNHLAKRLLGGRSASNDQERNVISKLKSECGTSFTHKLEGMFKDMQLSHDIMEEFNGQAFAASLDIELSVQVLTTGFWPQQQGNCQLPPEIVQLSETFKTFYLKNHTGRRLTWQTTMGTADLKAKFKKASHEISMSTTQMAILMLFNEADELSFGDIQNATAMDPRALKKDLLSLACAKYKILKKDPKSKKVREGDNFTFNKKFTCKLYKFKIPVIIVKESAAEVSITRAKISEDRKFLIDAAVVRIMKARKTLDHNNLVAEVTQQLSARFHPNPTDIKKQIEKLIEREYLERNPNNRRSYNYLA